MADPVRSVSALSVTQAVDPGPQEAPRQRCAADSTLASAGLDEGRAAEAIEFARRELSTQPRDAELLMLLGRSLCAAGDFAGAERPLLEAMMLAPTDSEPCIWLARSALRLGDSYRAVRLLRRVIVLGGIDDQVAELYARAHLAWEQKKKAAPRPHIGRQSPSQPPPPLTAVVDVEAPEDLSWEALLEQAKGYA